MSPLERRLAMLEKAESGAGFPWHIPFSEWPESEQGRVAAMIDAEPCRFSDAQLRHVAAAP